MAVTVIAGDEDCNATRSLLGVQWWGWVLPKHIPSNFLLASCWLPRIFLAISPSTAQPPPDHCY